MARFVHNRVGTPRSTRLFAQERVKVQARQQSRKLGVLALSFMLILMTASGCAKERSRTLVSLKQGALHPSIEFNDAEIVSSSGDAIRVKAGGKEEWPNITFRPIDAPWDLRGWYMVKVDLANPGYEPIRIGLRLDNPYKKKEDAPQHAQGFELLGPGESRTMSIRLSAEDWVFSKPLDLVGMRRAPGVELMNISNIDRISVFTGLVDGPHEFIVSNIRAEGEVRTVDGSDFLPFVDTYGQYRHTDWMQKVHSEDDFEKIRVAEEGDIAANPGPANRGKFGGWTKGPELEATGAFRVEKVDGKWWLVDPEGYLFWSTGPTCVDPTFGYTGIEGRENYFEDLPAEDGPLATCYSQCTWAPHGFYADKIPFKMFRFYWANLMRKYGDSWREEWIDSTHNRLKSWGMNTVANWAARDVCLKQRTPYTANFFIRGNKPLAGSAGYWSKFHDVFDPSFRTAIQKNLKRFAKETKDPWCIGFFVDNELSWGNNGISLARETLACPPDQPAKQEFVRDLKARYGEIGKLNRAWNTRHASWDALLSSRKAPDVGRAGGDLKRFYAKTADTYFRVIKEELKKAAPERLYLGCRFAWVNEAVASAAARRCDVVSYNKYEHSVRHLSVPKGFDRPIIIGEYHFGATDRGHFHPGLRDSDGQQDRAEKFKAYLRSALDNPQMVGVHWFQYVDEHIAGRADGENYNVGLVDICDTPYPEMVTAIRDVGSTMYEYRSR